MNRFKKEQKRKRDEARKGLSPEKIEILDKKEAKLNEIRELARKIHIKRFPEEYDFMYDSISDANERAMGKNPMSKEYIERINAKRAALGVSRLSESGMSTSDDTMDICFKEAEKLIMEMKEF
jgi:hypothetical protein